MCVCVSVRIRAKSKPVFFSFSSFLFIQIFLIYLFLLLFCCHSIWVRFIYCFQCLFFCEGGEKAEMDFYNADKIDQYRCCFVLFVSFFILSAWFCCYFAINFARRQCWPSLVSTGVDWVYGYVCVCSIDAPILRLRHAAVSIQWIQTQKLGALQFFLRAFSNHPYLIVNEIITHLYEQWWW